MRVLLLLSVCALAVWSPQVLAGVTVLQQGHPHACCCETDGGDSCPCSEGGSQCPLTKDCRICPSATTSLALPPLDTTAVQMPLPLLAVLEALEVSPSDGTTQPPVPPPRS